MLFGPLFATIMPDPQRMALVTVTDSSTERGLLFQSLLTEQPSRIPVRRNRSANGCSGRKSQVSSSLVQLSSAVGIRLLYTLAVLVFLGSNDPQLLGCYGYDRSITSKTHAIGCWFHYFVLIYY